MRIKTKSNLVKLSLIVMLTAGANNALANPNNQQNNEQDEVVITPMGPDDCPDAPYCFAVKQLEREEDQ